MPLDALGCPLLHNIELCKCFPPVIVYLCVLSTVDLHGLIVVLIWTCNCSILNMTHPSLAQSLRTSFLVLTPIPGSYLLMRLHYLWPRKLQNCTIPVNLEAIQTTTITSKLFWPLYLGYNRVLHYTVYGLRLSNFNISLASLDLSAIFKYILKKLNYLQLLQSSTGTASYDIRLQS